ncbi:hypothetical protein ACXYL9_12345 [Qipengyuania sp. CAU 1752]
MAPTGRKGQPLVALILVIGGWALLRALNWTSPFQEESVQAAQTVMSRPAAEAASLSYPVEMAGQSQELPSQGTASPDVLWVDSLNALGNALRSEGAVRYPRPAQRAAVVQKISEGTSQLLRAGPPTTDPEPAVGRAKESVLRDSVAQTAAPRWGVDGWLFWREGGGSLVPASADRPASYGASQAGLVARYFVGQSRSTFLFARASKALDTGGETDWALGGGTRPISSVPVVALTELRATHRQGNWHLRPAVTLVTELPPLSISEKVNLEAYVQAGYVGGDFPTPFADGQLRVERRLGDFSGAKLRVGAGAWGGAQEGAARFDLGPTASLHFDLGKMPVRLSADYRLRTAGNAEPSSGFALTLSSGF